MYFYFHFRLKYRQLKFKIAESFNHPKNNYKVC